MGLPLWSAPLPEEPAHGLVMRLAEVNGYPKIQSVLDETGLSTARLHRGEQLEMLAAIIRKPVEAIAADSFRLEDHGKLFVRGQRLNLKLDYMIQDRRACPACLRESAHHRFMWDLSFITTCPRHGLKLEGTCACGSGRKLGWLDPRVYRGRCCRTGDLRQVAGEKGAPDVVEMDAYFAGRLGVGPEVEVPAIDDMALCDVVEVVDRIGALALGGYKKHWQTLRKAGALGSPAMAVGYRILKDDRLQETLDAVYDGFLVIPDHPPPSLTVAYGWFYHWYNLKGNSRFSRYLTEEIYRHAAQRFRIDRRAMRNKSIVVSDATNALMDAFDRGRMTLSDAAKRCGSDNTHIRRFAVSYGLMRTEKLVGRAVLIEDRDVELFRFLNQRMILRRWAAIEICAPPRFVDSLRQDGVLVPILDANGGPRQYLVDDLHDLLALFEKASSREPIKGRSVCIARCCGPYHLDTIVKKLREGTLNAHIVTENARGLARYRFRRADLKRCRRRDVVTTAPVPGPARGITWLRDKIHPLMEKACLQPYRRIRRQILKKSHHPTNETETSAPTLSAAREHVDSPPSRIAIIAENCDARTWAHPSFAAALPTPAAKADRISTSSI